MELDHDTALEPSGDGRWSGAVADGWSTPRGPLGGYVMAILMRGLELAVDDAERQARSVSCHFLRPPEAGPVEVEAQVERSGRSLSTVSGRLTQDGKPIAIAVGAYSKPWTSPDLGEWPMPDVEGPSAEFNPVPDDAPPFAHRVGMERRFGAKPFTRSDDATVGGWLGLREERPIDALAIAILADSWFPAPWSLLDNLAAAPTIDLTVHFRAPLPVEGPLLLGRFENKLVRDGFFEEDGELWAPDGTLVAHSRQLALLLTG
ncbi:thioesterase family protein [Thermoleophilia bacterium SCSIO 60948]|nr:thioesterase family protein [Thermoleophilia bacterium SCSIO 60948]